nr:immunoglobulin light chain junction region [Macaca mulatta]MOY04875.1 immunoglobulin light chain junction region [Macaca mulatta]MOY05079.1 immunoglobulin light chain junction region [Macaca mulatta]MOY05463.1 immunoglobulin light chain junction region [Macaca mulatta]MOY05541.1 immunoglobulin light chain junction region [Macaca mulatta]
DYYCALNMGSGISVF